MSRAAALPKLLSRAVGQTAGLLNVSKVGEKMEISHAAVTACLPVERLWTP